MVETNNAHSTAFAELISYIHCFLEEESLSPVFKLSVLKKNFIAIDLLS